MTVTAAAIIRSGSTMSFAVLGLAMRAVLDADPRQIGLRGLGSGRADGALDDEIGRHLDAFRASTPGLSRPIISTHQKFGFAMSSSLRVTAM